MREGVNTLGGRGGVCELREEGAWVEAEGPEGFAGGLEGFGGGFGTKKLACSGRLGGEKRSVKPALGKKKNLPGKI
jgi:hypothetical protein